MAAKKTDCTGQRFGYLTVLGKGEMVCKNNVSRQLWRLQCDCNTEIQKPRSYFESGRQKSCGRKECVYARKTRTSSRNSRDITNQRYGALIAVRLSGNKDKRKQPTWTMYCDCGNYAEFSIKDLNRMQRFNVRINCKDSTRHPENGLCYPPTPAPYHPEASILLKKYLPLVRSSGKLVNSAVEDEKIDILIRACWIVVYRRLFLGEEISELKEKRLIRKHLRYASIHVFRKSRLY